MRKKILISCGLSLLILIAGSVVAGRIETANRTVEADGADRLSIECEFGAGRFTVMPADMEEVAKVDITYEPNHISYDVSYDVRRGTGHLYMASEYEDNRDNHDLENEWDVTLSTRYPTELIVEMGACDAALDLGGIPLEETVFEVGAASGIIDFTSRNPRRMKEMTIEIGASSIEIMRLGNANFDYLDFEGGVASCELDFSGDYNGESVARIEVGLGSADIIVPEGLALRLETDDAGWFSSVDFDDLDVEEVGRGVYESPDFDRADGRLVLILDVGMGSIDIYYGR